MKQPKISNLKVDQVGTKRIRNEMVKAKKIKITINLDSDLLGVLREMADSRGTPYQTLVNRLLRQVAMEAKSSIDESRLDRIEKQLAQLKRKVI